MKQLVRFLVTIGLAGVVSTNADASELYAAFWNVENLFDTEDDPDVEGDEEFTPNAKKQWTFERLDIKLNNLARVIREMNDTRGPDLLGLCEVENRGVIQSLIGKLRPLRRDYAIVHQDSPSDRGIDCAILYDRNRLQLAAFDFLFVDADKTRDIVEAAFESDTNRLYVFVNHWPSRYNPESARITAATVLRGRLDQILKMQPDADILILGDLNDTPTNVSVGKHLKTWGDPNSLRPGVFFNSTYPIHRQNKGTYVYENRWELMDHVILSPGLLDERGFRWKPGSTKVLLKEDQLYFSKNLDLIPRPSRSFTNDTFHENGYSDHLPVSCVLQY